MTAFAVGRKYAERATVTNRLYFRMTLNTTAVISMATLLLLTACGQKGPLYMEREAPPEVSTAPGASDVPRKPTRTTIEPASKDNTSTELPPVVE